MLLNVTKMKKHVMVFAAVAIVAIAGIGVTVSALAAENAPKPHTENSITEMQTDLAINQPAISYDDYKIWIEKQKAVIQELVRTGKWSQESADAGIKRYERILSAIENGTQVPMLAEYPDETGEETLTLIPPSDFKTSLTDDGFTSD